MFKCVDKANMYSVSFALWEDKPCGEGSEGSQGASSCEAQASHHFNGCNTVSRQWYGRHPGTQKIGSLCLSYLFPVPIYQNSYGVSAIGLHIMYLLETPGKPEK